MPSSPLPTQSDAHTWAIFNASGNALAWFTDEPSARAELDAMLAEYPDADVDLVAFDEKGNPCS